MQSFGPFQSCNKIMVVFLSRLLIISRKTAKHITKPRLIQPDKGIGIPFLKLPILNVGFLLNKIKQNSSCRIVINDWLEVLIKHLKAKAHGTGDLSSDSFVTLK